jgi:ParB-like chromosome segregation protein Spo0J
MVAEHDVNPIHRRRRDDFVVAIKSGLSLPPLIALGDSRQLVDGYARLRAARILELVDVEVIVNDTERVLTDCRP